MPLVKNVSARLFQAGETKILPGETKEVSKVYFREIPGELEIVTKNKYKPDEKKEENSGFNLG